MPTIEDDTVVPMIVREEKVVPRSLYPNNGNKRMHLSRSSRVLEFLDVLRTQISNLGTQKITTHKMTLKLALNSNTQANAPCTEHRASLVVSEIMTYRSMPPSSALEALELVENWCTIVLPG